MLPPTQADHPSDGNTLAIISLVSGIGCFVPGIGIMSAPFALITGYLALRRAKNYTPGLGKRGMAITGITLGSLSLAVYLLIALLFLLPSFGIHKIGFHAIALWMIPHA
jgi:hypothetical protein